MNWFKRAFSRRNIYDDLAEEMRLHLDEKIEFLIAHGVTREQAEFQAKREFGNVTLMEERSREIWQWQFAESTWADLKYTLRRLRKSPWFALTAVITIGAGIGANAVAFGLLSALILRPLNLPQARNLYMVERGNGRPWATQSYPDYLDLRDRNHTFDGLVVYGLSPAGLNTDGVTTRIWLFEASGNYFDVLGVKPYLGRLFHDSDEHGADKPPYIVLSFAYWRSQFQSDPRVVGRIVELNKQSFRIIGVAPPQFFGTDLFYAPDLWVPISNQERTGGDLESRGAHSLYLLGRLKTGVIPAQGAIDLNSIASNLSKKYPKEDGGLSFYLTRPGLLGDMLRGPVSAFVGSLALLTSLIFLAACANLGSLFAVRSADHAKEVALRLALGASHKRVLRQLLTEVVVVSLAGGLLGVAGSVALLKGLSMWRPVPFLPLHISVNPDGHTYFISLVLALASGVFVGIAPAVQVLRSEPHQMIRGAGTGTTRPRRFTLRDLLLVGQIALCAVLVSAALVAALGLFRILRANLGFLPQDVVVVSTDLGMAGYGSEQQPIMQRRMLNEVKTISGVTAAAYADPLPLNLEGTDLPVFRDSGTDLNSSNAAAMAMPYSVSPGYFAAAGTSLLAGRTFTWVDDKDAPPVAVVNREFARELFGSEANAVGAYFKSQHGTRVLVVGVAQDGKYMTLTEDPRPAVFFPVLQSPSSTTWLVVRSKRDPQELMTALDHSLRSIDAGLPLTTSTWRTQLDIDFFAARAAAVALCVLGGLGAMMAITGIFGMAAYSVSQRLPEFGVRIALGSQRREILRTALWPIFRVFIVGLGAGLLLCLTATRVLSPIVFAASPNDPLVLVGVFGVMLLLALLATWIPARRAIVANLSMLLREE